VPVVPGHVIVVNGSMGATPAGSTERDIGRTEFIYVAFRTWLTATLGVIAETGTELGIFPVADPNSWEKLIWQVAHTIIARTSDKAFLNPCFIKSSYTFSSRLKEYSYSEAALGPRAVYLGASVSEHSGCQLLRQFSATVSVLQGIDSYALIS
jgi:hypothetical protein